MANSFPTDSQLSRSFVTASQQLSSFPLVPGFSQAAPCAQVMKLLLAEKEARDAAGWRAFQSSCQTLKLRRTRALGEAQVLQAAIDAATRAIRLRHAEPGAHDAPPAIS